MYFTDFHKPQTTLYAQSQSSGSALGSVVDASGFDRVCYFVTAGSGAAGATLDIQIQESAGSAGTFTDITGGSIVQVTDSTDQTTFTVDVPASGSKPYQKAKRTSASAAMAFSVIAIPYGGNHKNPPTLEQTEVRV